MQPLLVARKKILRFRSKQSRTHRGNQKSVPTRKRKKKRSPHIIIPISDGTVQRIHTMKGSLRRKVDHRERFICRREAKTRKANRIGQSQGQKPGSALRTVAEAPRCLQAEGTARSAREGKGAGESQRTVVLKKFWGDVLWNTQRNSQRKIRERTETDSKAKGGEWKRRKKVEMKAKVKRSE